MKSKTRSTLPQTNLPPTPRPKTSPQIPPASHPTRPDHRPDSPTEKGAVSGHRARQHPAPGAAPPPGKRRNRHPAVEYEIGHNLTDSFPRRPGGRRARSGRGRGPGGRRRRLSGHLAGHHCCPTSVRALPGRPRAADRSAATRSGRRREDRGGLAGCGASRPDGPVRSRFTSPEGVMRSPSLRPRVLGCRFRASDAVAHVSAERNRLARDGRDIHGAAVEPPGIGPAARTVLDRVHGDGGADAGLTARTWSAAWAAPSVGPCRGPKTSSAGAPRRTRTSPQPPGSSGGRLKTATQAATAWPPYQAQQQAGMRRFDPRSAFHRSWPTGRHRLSRPTNSTSPAGASVRTGRAARRSVANKGSPRKGFGPSGEGRHHEDSVLGQG